MQLLTQSLRKHTKRHGTSVPFTTHQHANVYQSAHGYDNMSKFVRVFLTPRSVRLRVTIHGAFAPYRPIQFSERPLRSNEVIRLHFHGSRNVPCPVSKSPHHGRHSRPLRTSLTPASPRGACLRSVQSAAGSSVGAFQFAACVGDLCLPRAAGRCRETRLSGPTSKTTVSQAVSIAGESGRGRWRGAGVALLP